MSPARAALLLVLLLAIPGCDQLFGEADEEVAPVASEVQERVMSEILSRMTASHEEVGPEFPNRLEQIKRDACEREGYAGWDDFARHVRVGAPSGDVELTRRITAHMNSLLSPAEK